MKSLFLASTLFLFGLFFSPPVSRAVSEPLVLKGRLIQENQVELFSGQKINVDNPSSDFVVGDQVVLTLTDDTRYVIFDHLRLRPLLILFALFSLVSIAIGRIRGLTSLLGMAISFLVIFSFILPQLSLGRNPLMIAVLGSFLIAPVTFYLSHGLNLKTTVSIISTLLALTFTGLVAGFFINFAHLSGFAAEEAGFVVALLGDGINIRGLLLAGIIIGSLGILDDVTVSQAAIVFQLKKTDPKLKFSDLYRKAMDIGHDHISSMVNTLVLVYTGASLPLLLLFINTSRPYLDLLNYEILAEEIVRTLVGSIGLILAVPVTTFLAATIASKSAYET